VKPNVVAGLAGLLFGLGIVVSGMAQPQKVIGFLDVTGRWDGGLMLVMMGAIGVHFPLLRLINRRRAPLLAPDFFRIDRTQIDRPLVIGAVLFGVGWGMAGFCPGPALVSLPSLQLSTLWFVAAMFGGMLLFALYERARSR
jgi:uncharacterized membrane protein YedE/YeeE